MGYQADGFEAYRKFHVWLSWLYARPLAVLTTFKGREILRSTKELAEFVQSHMEGKD
jgi:DNA polymerase elongation subunit (family B)